MKNSALKICTAIFFLLISCVCASAKTYELNSGNLKLKVFSRSGSFCLYQLSAKGKNSYIPLYDDRAQASTNRFSVSFNGTIYRLERKIWRPVKIEQTDNEISLTFEIKNKLYIVQRLSFIPDIYGTSGAILKVQTEIENTSCQSSDIALKAVFDTLLGERRRASVSTDLRAGIYTESILQTNADKDSVIISANSDSACMLFFRQQDSVPAEIYISNWERLQTKHWLPKAVQGRSFNTKYLHNDSAVLFVWPEKKLGCNGKMSVTLCIGHYDYIRAAGGFAEEEKISEQEKKNYEYIKALLDKIHKIEENPDAVSDSDIQDMTEQADGAIKDIQEHK